MRRDGPEALGRIEGMFALALWNGTDRTLLLARDRIGIKPLYYAVLPGGFAFASEPKALVQLPSVAARLEPEASPTSSPTGTSPSTAASSPTFANSLPLTG